jgi:hypothetical protein
MDAHLPTIAKAFAEAIRQIDETEPMIRDLIERKLMTVAGVSGTKISKGVTVAKQLSAEINVIRSKAIKSAFRHLRDNLPSDNGL